MYIGGGYKHLLSVAIRQEKREELGIGINDFAIISVGELNDNKNHQVIIKALTQLPDTVKYILVGKGDLEEQLKALAKELGVSDRVIFTGFRTDVKELLYAADCFAFPSKREGLGIAALEGMSSGLPVIGHDIGGIRDFVVDGETGWLCREDEEYGRAIMSCMNRKQDMHNTCLKKSQEFSLEKTDSIMKDVYKNNER